MNTRSCVVTQIRNVLPDEICTLYLKNRLDLLLDYWRVLRLFRVRFTRRIWKPTGVRALGRSIVHVSVTGTQAGKLYFAFHNPSATRAMSFERSLFKERGVAGC